ncbi:MAG TPA: peptidyl-prolyl cis-trans isomerase [Thermoanaerobaculia bacterium]|nr:peptidyl-prolyl cis-trans isomerase [Thermoanaerobaculia bacterium]
MPARRLLISLLVVCTFASACKRKPATPPDVIVKVNERMLTLADFKRYLERNAGTDLAQLTPEVASAMLDQFVEEIIVSEYAAAHGVEVPAEKIAAAVRTEAGVTVIEKRDQMRREKLLTDMAADIPDPSPAEMQSYYNANQGEFRSGEEVRVRQILVHDETLANDIRKRLNQGASFEELSTQHSRAPNARRGGEIGFVSRGELPKMFEDEIFRLKPGEISDPIQTDSSFHIFRVDERRAPGMLDAESAAPLIRVRLKEETLRERAGKVVARSRREMKIDVLTRRLPFRYTGGFRIAEDE